MDEMSGNSSNRRLDRSVFRVVDWDEHVANHDAELRDYWLSQSMATRLAGAMRCRRRVHGLLPPLNRTTFRVISLTELPD